ncbi:hypothetical protein OC00_00145 [Xanthomonas vasicola]|nr:hypothetical protein NX07_06590 [Xanthomonas vasicola]KGT85934.1 hypothetical protein OC00_00145 [Xanthomonas vasicola]
MHDAVEVVAQGKRRRSIDLWRASIDLLSRRLEVKIEIRGDQLDAIRCTEQAYEIAVQVIGGTSHWRQQAHGTLMNGDSSVLQPAKEAIKWKLWGQSSVPGDFLGEIPKVVQIRRRPHRNTSARKDDELAVLDGINDPIVKLKISQSWHASLSVPSASLALRFLSNVGKGDKAASSPRAQPTRVSHLQTGTLK